MNNLLECNCDSQNSYMFQSGPRALETHLVEYNILYEMVTVFYEITEFYEMVACSPTFYKLQYIKSPNKEMISVCTAFNDC